MRFLGTKPEPKGLVDTVTDSLAAVRHGEHRGTLLKGALIAGGVAALTAGSAAISSLRRRIEANS
jgi:hypothetical protein